MVIIRDFQETIISINEEEFSITIEDEQHLLEFILLPEDVKWMISKLEKMIL
jgi:hypothetical protein